MLTTTLATTDSKPLTMCVGTAENESKSSWEFFLIDLGHSLMNSIPESKQENLVFMSDRHTGIIDGVEKWFLGKSTPIPSYASHREYQISDKQQWILLGAAEADDEEEFEDNFQEVVKASTRAEPLSTMKGTWCCLDISITLFEILCPYQQLG